MWNYIIPCYDSDSILKIAGYISAKEELSKTTFRLAGWCLNPCRPGLFLGIWNWGGYRQMFVSGCKHERSVNFILKNRKKTENITLSRGGVVFQLGGGGLPPLEGCKNITAVVKEPLHVVASNKFKENRQQSRAETWVEQDKKLKADVFVLIQSKISDFTNEHLQSFTYVLQTNHIQPFNLYHVTCDLVNRPITSNRSICPMWPAT